MTDRLSYLVPTKKRPETMLLPYQIPIMQPALIIGELKFRFPTGFPTPLRMTINVLLMGWAQ
jgi:hypothetical protein